MKGFRESYTVIATPLSFRACRVVYSTEVPGPVKLLPLPDEEFEKGAVHQLGALDHFRVRILPVIGLSPHLCSLLSLTRAYPTLSRPSSLDIRPSYGGLYYLPAGRSTDCSPTGF